MALCFGFDWVRRVRRRRVAGARVVAALAVRRWPSGQAGQTAGAAVAAAAAAAARRILSSISSSRREEAEAQEEEEEEEQQLLQRSRLRWRWPGRE
eukprot:COSAG06_NODE_497_length_15020_cov_7.417733_11_plen_96_part_00